MYDNTTLERPSKRPRLFYESSDPELNRKRARHDLHLKSRFEAIFQKYEKDFSQTADEIDLETGEIVVNNGHLAAMTDEFDSGHDLDSTSHQQRDVWTTADNLDSQDTNWIVSDEEGMPADSALDIATPPTTGSIPIHEDLSNRLKTGRGGVGSRALDLGLENRKQVEDSSPTTGNRMRSSAANGFVDTPNQVTKLQRPALETAWQAPPLPEDQLRSLDTPELSTTSPYETGGTRSPSPPVGSLWAPMASRGRPRREGQGTQIRRPTKSRRSIQIDDSALDTDLNQHRNITSGVSSRSRLPWTHEEELLLTKLKTTTKLMYTELEPYFPGRTWRSIAFRWSQEMHCGKRTPWLNGSPKVNLKESAEIEENGKPQNQSPSTHRKIQKSSSTKAGIPKRSKLPAKIPSKLPLKRPGRAAFSRISSSTHDHAASTLRLATTSDYDDELGDHPLEDKLSALRLTKSSPLAATSCAPPLYSASKAVENRKAAAARKSEAKVTKQHHLLRTPLALSPADGDELSDADELGHSPPRELASAPSFRIRLQLSPTTPVPFRAQKRQVPSPKATATPRPALVDDFSEDELATPMQVVRTPQILAKKLVGSSRRKSSHW